MRWRRAAKVWEGIAHLWIKEWRGTIRVVPFDLGGMLLTIDTTQFIDAYIHLLVRIRLEAVDRIRLVLGRKEGSRLLIGGEEFEPMKIAPLADVKARLSAHLDECQIQGPVVITRNGRAVAVLVAPRDDDLERLILARSPRFQNLLRRSRVSIKAGRGLRRTEFWTAVKSRTGGRTGRRQGS